MNLLSRITLSITAMSLLSGGFWVFLIPHFLYQYALIVGASSIFGGAMFAITDTGEDEEIEEELEQAKIIEEKNNKVESFLNNFNSVIENLKTESKKIINPMMNRKFDKIYKFASKINKYALENDCLDKLNVWNNVYVPNITKLVKEYNTIYSMPDQNEKVLFQIEEFNKLSDEILDNFARQYDDLINGKIESFSVDMTLIRQVHDMKGDN